MFVTSVIALAALAVAAPAGEAPEHQLARRYDSDNWCGVVTTHKNIYTIEATWTVPTISIPTYGDKTDHYSTYQWVGMGGSGNCGSSTDLAQAGSGMEITDGVITYYAYYQMFGSNSTPQINDDITISAGDEIYVKVTRTSSTKATYYWWNKTTGKTSTTTLKSNRGRTICNLNAAWIHERPGLTRRPFPAFTNFDFTGAMATTGGQTPQTVNLHGGENWIMTKDQTDTKLCHPKKNSNTSVSIIEDEEWY